jgi:NTP pyrophosphatase (non-canonical NTP hydrolase)
MTEFKELNNRVITWAKNKGILQKATPLAQMRKTIEEVEETRDALIAQANNLQRYINSKGVEKDTKEEIIDGFGDILVTILIGCKMQHVNPLDALELALNIIEKRTGKMINGTFVKDN